MAEVVESQRIRGVHVVTPDVHGDERGMFVETWRKEWIPGVNEMVQANRADRTQGSLVGLHYHRFQADYWYVPAGRALVALHDLREGSPTDGASEVFEVGGDDHRGVYIPPGVAHGFYAVTDMTITYLVDGYYNPDDELGVAWDDPAVGITWPTRDPVVSNRDRSNPKRSEIPPDLRPRWTT
ncbi:MAG TPA: dTDP-4-dehydrorhamnose 3,5-epimerase [Acidimicrobiia bacterium]|nr:dTDP-4-dehydrorhamnose 3,5-epimerase [Acidimicrobiia bacterium]